MAITKRDPRNLLTSLVLVFPLFLVYQVGLAILQLGRARTCEERKGYVDRLRALGDRRALPALRGLRGHTIGRIRLGGSNTSCMKKDLPAAIKALESKT